MYHLGAKDRRLNDSESWRSKVKESHLVRSFLLYQSMAEGLLWEERVEEGEQT